jgi:hypothetical protein
MALRYADYGYILENGRIVMDGAAKALRENEDVKEFYLGMGGGDRKSFRDVKSYRAQALAYDGGQALMATTFFAPPRSSRPRRWRSSSAACATCVRWRARHAASSCRASGDRAAATRDDRRTRKRPARAPEWDTLC